MCVKILKSFLRYTYTQKYHCCILQDILQLHCSSTFILWFGHNTILSCLPGQLNLCQDCGSVNCKLFSHWCIYRNNLCSFCAWCLAVNLCNKLHFIEFFAYWLVLYFGRSPALQSLLSLELSSFQCYKICI